MSQQNLKLKFAKCEFANSSDELLGHTVNTGWIAAKHVKLTAINTAPAPHSSTSVRTILRLAGYCRPSIREFSDISAALSPSKAKTASPKWKEEMQKELETLLLKLKIPPVLTFPDFQNTFSVETDAFATDRSSTAAKKEDIE